MPKFELDIDNQGAMQATNQLAQALKSVYQLIQQIKGGLGDLGIGGTGGAGGFIGGANGTASNAAAGSATAGGGLNLAGAFGGVGAGLNLGSILAAQGGINGTQALNPSIQLAQNQSVMAGVTGGNPAARSAFSATISNGFAVPDSTDAGRDFTNAMGGPNDWQAFDYRMGMGGGGRARYSAAKSAYISSAGSAYQGGQLNDAFNKFAGTVPAWNNYNDDFGSASDPSWDMQMRGMAQREFSQHRQFVFGMAGVVGLGAANIANQYTQGVVSGQQNAMGMGSAYGSVIGGALGFAAGGYFGAAVGASIGGTAANVVQGPYQARYQAAISVGGFAASTGRDAMGMVRGAESDAKSIDDPRISAGEGQGLRFFSGDGIRRTYESVLRGSGLYQGTDQISTQQMANIQGSLGAGYLQSGVNVSTGALRARATAIGAKYGGAIGEGVAASYGKALGGMAAAGDNLTDLALSVGIGPVSTMLNEDGRSRSANSLISGYGAYQRASYGFAGVQSAAQGAGADYDASGFNGLSTRARSGAFSTMQAASQAAVGAIDAELGALSSMPGGANSNEAKAKRALKSQLMADIAREASNRASGLLGDAQGEGGVALSSANIELTRANLYGGAGSFAGAGREVLGALDSEASGIRNAMQDSHLSYSDRLRGQTRLNEIASQRIMVPAQMAGAAMRRNLMGADVAANQAGYAYNASSAYGSDADLGASALGGINAQQSIIGAAQAALRDPNLSVEDRANAQNQITGAQNAQLQLRIGSRDTLLGRIGGRASVAQGAAGYALTRASVLGTGSDLRKAAAGLSGAYNDESKQLQSQLDAGGLTVEQEIRTRGRLNSLKTEAFSTDQSVIDAGYAKDDLTGYSTPMRKIQGQQERLQYLPFSASNPIKLSLQQINLNKKQLGVLDARESALKSAGNLSPEREDEIEGQRQSLYTQNAAAVSQISEGFINRLPSMSAGAPSFSGRLNSYSMAAMQLQMMGSPIRSFGAQGGGQLQTQDDFIRAAGGSPDEIAARSTTTGLNSSGETNALLKRMTDALERIAGMGGSNSGMRPGETAGNAYSQLSRRDVGQSNPAPSHN